MGANGRLVILSGAVVRRESPLAKALGRFHPDLHATLRRRSTPAAGSPILLTSPVTGSAPLPSAQRSPSLASSRAVQ
jgi:hypothetical protein